MQTVYLLAGCKDSSNALYKLRRSPDMTTLIVVVPKSQKKLLTLDKRVKSFPFIINTPPTRQGLIPKRAVVMSFGKAVKVSQGLRTKFRTRFRTKFPVKPVNKYSSRVVNIPPVSQQKIAPNRILRPLRPLRSLNRVRPLMPLNRVPINPSKKMDFSITKVKNVDGHTLILKKN